MWHQQWLPRSSFENSVPQPVSLKLASDPARRSPQTCGLMLEVMSIPDAGFMVHVACYHEVPWGTMTHHQCTKCILGLQNKGQHNLFNCFKTNSWTQVKVYQGSMPLLCQAPHTRMGPPSTAKLQHHLLKEGIEPHWDQLQPQWKPSIDAAINSIRSGQDFELPYDCFSSVGNK